MKNAQPIWHPTNLPTKQHNARMLLNWISQEYVALNPFHTVVWKYAEDNRCRRQAFNNCRSTMVNRCGYLHTRTRSETMFINYLPSPDVGRDTVFHFGSTNSKLEEMFRANSLGPRESQTLLYFCFDDREKSRSQSSTFWHIREKHGFHFLIRKFRLSIERLSPPMKLIG